MAKCCIRPQSTTLILTLNDYYSNSERDYPDAFNGILIYEPTPGEEFLFWRKKCCIWHSMAWDGSLWHTMESMEQLRLTYL